MSETFHLPVVYQGQELEFKARFEQFGFTQQFVVLIGEQSVTFESDEEGGFRALGDGSVDIDLLKAIANTLVALQDA